MLTGSRHPPSMTHDFGLTLHEVAPETTDRSHWIVRCEEYCVDD